MRKYVIAIAIIMAGAAAAWAAWPCAAEDTTVRKIETAEKAGLLSADEALMYKFMALYTAYEDEVPAAYRGEWYAPQEWTCGTPVAVELWQRWPEMDPAVKRRLQEVCGLGESQLDLFALYRRCSWGDSRYGGVKVYTYDTPEGNFRVHYVLEGTSALEDPSDKNNNGIPDHAENIGADLERAFAQFSKDKWYYIPDPEDQQYFPLKDRYEALEWPAEGNDYGGNDRWDAYLGRLSGGVGGIAFGDQAFPYTYRDDFSGYMNLRNIYRTPAQSTFNEPVISAHEFMHVSQFQIDIGTPSWYLEATAMWSEDTVYPNAPDPNGRMSSYLGNTLRSIDNTGDGGYIACAINFFLRDWCWRLWRAPEWREVEGWLTPREVWRAGAKGDPWYTNDPRVNRGDFDAIDYVIRYHHRGRSYVPDRAFVAAYELFTTWNWFTGARDDDKHYRWDYSPVGLQNQWGQGEYPIVNFEPTEAYRMNYRGHGFYYFTGLPAWEAAIFTFEGDPTNLEQSKDWGGYVMVSKNGTTWTDLQGRTGLASYMCSPADKGIIQVRSPGQYQALVMSLNNTAEAGSALKFNYSVIPTSDTTPPAISVAAVRPQANPDYVEFLLGADEDIFGAPEAEIFFQPNRGEERAAAVSMSGTERSFIGTFIMELGENGSGQLVWRAADEAGNIVDGEKNFSAGFLAAGGGTVGGEPAALKVAAGTVAGPTLFSIVPGEARAPAANAAAALPGSGASTVETVGVAYDVGPTWGRLAKPVEIALSYEGLEVREDYLSVYQWNGSGWTDLGGVIDKRAHRVIATANNLGRFILGYGELKGDRPPGGKPKAFGLYQNYPNPAHEATVIKYALPEAAEVELAVYDLSGRRVATVESGPKDAGVYETHYGLTDDAGRALPAGVYLYRLTAGTETGTRKLIVTP